MRLPTLPPFIAAGAALISTCSLLPASTTTDTWNPGPAWTLVWADEFDGDALDPTKWTHDLGTGHNGWGNNERQSYTRENAAVANGELVITAAQHADGSYTSARLKTQGLHAWTYGKFAARLRLPKGQGIWPAFWMLGENISTIGWPRCGEIDIMEMIGGAATGRDDSYHGTLHYHKNGAHTYHGPGSWTLPAPQIFHDAYHVFEVEWSPTAIIWRIDGQEHGREIMDLTLRPEMDAFHLPFFLIMNLAVGGNWPGYPDATTEFPQTLRADWVRVYQADPS